MDFPQTNRTTLKRLPKRGVYDRRLVYGILDEGFICHVGFAVEGQPFVIPTGYAPHHLGRRLLKAGVDGNRRYHQPEQPEKP